MNQTFIREISLIGEENFQKLQNARVAVFGIGGVGSYAAEALVRAGVGHLLFVDGDTVADSNLNRQLVALRSTLGKNKASVMRERALDISPETEIETFEGFFDETTADSFDFSRFSYVADCIDSVKAKVLLLSRARETIAACPCEKGCPSCVGTPSENGKRDAVTLIGRILDEQFAR